MLVEIFEKREEMRAKKEYEKNLGRISDLDDICSIIEDLIDRVNDIDFESKQNFTKEMRAWENDFIAEMKFYEDENLNLEEVWEEISNGD